VASAFLGNLLVKAYKNQKVFFLQILGVRTEACMVSNLLWNLNFYIAFGLVELVRVAFDDTPA